MTFKDPTSPAVNATAVTPSDVTVFDPPTKALYIGADGNVAVMLADDTAAVTFVGVVAGQILPLRAKKVMSTNTTASNIVALF